jgi:hypothetical protein
VERPEQLVAELAGGDDVVGLPHEMRLEGLGEPPRLDAGPDPAGQAAGVDLVEAGQL